MYSKNVTLYWFHINYLTKLKCPENDIHTVELLLFFFFLLTQLWQFLFIILQTYWPEPGEVHKEAGRYSGDQKCVSIARIKKWHPNNAGMG